MSFIHADVSMCTVGSGARIQKAQPGNGYTVQGPVTSRMMVSGEKSASALQRAHTLGFPFPSLFPLRGPGRGLSTFRSAHHFLTAGFTFWKTDLFKLINIHVFIHDWGYVLFLLPFMFSLLL